MSTHSLSLTSVRRGALPRSVTHVGAFLAGFAPVAMLGFDGGGYAVATVAALGIALWWLLLVGVASDAIPRPAPNRLGTMALGATALLAAWGLITLGWSASDERGLTEVVRLVVFGGALLLGLSAVSGGQHRALVAGVLAALVLIVGAGVLSRLQPDLFAGSSDVATFLGERKRLSWPLNYWNAMGAVGGLAIPLALTVATRAESTVGSALAAGGLPILLLGLILTLSRGGLLATVLGFVTAVAFVQPRLVLIRTAIAPAAGGAILVLAVLESDPVWEAVGGAAQTDAGRGIIPLVLLVTVGVALTQAGWRIADEANWTPRLPRPGHRLTGAAVTAAVILALGGAAAVDMPDRAGDAWKSFKNADRSALQAQNGSISRLTGVNGSGRYEEWTNALDAIEGNPLGGIGLGSWDAWFSPRRETSPAARNAHSQPLEIGAETGLGGLILFTGIVLAPLTAAVLLCRRRRGFPPYALVALPSAVAFAVAVTIDWSWQLSAIPVAAALLAAPLLGRDTTVPEPVGAKANQKPADRRHLSVFAPVVATGVVGIASIAILAVAMIAPRGVDQSRGALAQGSLRDAAEAASRANSAVPFSLEAAVQRALVAERAGDLAAAGAAATEATRIEPRNWRPWMVLARIETARDRPKAAVAAYRRAKAINPRSRLINP